MALTAGQQKLLWAIRAKLMQMRDDVDLLMNEDAACLDVLECTWADWHRVFAEDVEWVAAMMRKIEERGDPRVFEPATT